ncbi:phage terminase large subunit [Veillonella atypica]|uniref:Terminase n=1 Tax=Veillonella atypica TaxID=39777 RepID=A0A3A6WL61_9FIRM|nr:phage terminase large subunit [Veillonella atypica]RJY50480.1 terminase [Veillonella atypica]
MTPQLEKHITYEAKLELARRDFFDYCELMAPDFYKRSRQYLVQLANTLQEFVFNSPKKVLVISIPPRCGKSRTASLFAEWTFGKDPTKKIMTGSYNETLSTQFAKTVRNTIQTQKVEPFIPVFSDVFPDVKIKQGDAAMNMWSLEGQYSSYLATSPSGTATGFGCSLMIIDDVIKNAQEANNQLTKQSHYEWFTNTMLSRLEEGGKIIIIMTRWASDDLAGRIINHFQDDAEIISLKALQDDGTMLCEDVLSRESYEEKKKLMSPDIFYANYQQEPIDLKGQLYTSFKTYDSLPQFEKIQSYTDTADTGSDYLCSIIYGIYQKEAYILDVIYTNEPMEITEPLVAKHIFEYKVNQADIESNNGGRGFSRQISHYLTNTYNTNHTIIRPFHQSKNKQARILSNATWVMEHIYFPQNWHNKYPEFYKAITSYQREGKNLHDDAPDALTGVAEKVNVLQPVFSFE